MLNEVVEIFLGCIHTYVNSDYWNMADAVFVPVACAIVLIFVCSFCIAFMHAFTAVVVHDTKK